MERYVTGIDGITYKTVETEKEIEQCLALFENSFLPGKDDI